MKPTFIVYLARSIVWGGFIFWILWLGISLLGVVSLIFNLPRLPVELAIYWKVGALSLFFKYLALIGEWASRVHRDSHD